MESNSTNNNIDEYLLSLTDKERLGYQIAMSHLGSAFRLDKSVGYIRWFEKEKKPTAT